jgi:hypothetical protein
MACWVIIRDSFGVHVFYDNLITGMRHSCGTVKEQCDDTEVLDWIFETGKPAYGDVIKMSDGSTLHYQPRRLETSAC